MKSIDTLAAVALLGLGLAACTPTTGLDDHAFHRPPGAQARTITLTVVEYDNARDMQAALPIKDKTVRRGTTNTRLNTPSLLHAWAEMREPKDGRPVACTVHMVRPEVRWQPEWLGHEVAHCVWDWRHDATDKIARR